MYHLSTGKTDINVANSPRPEAMLGLLRGPAKFE
jgi:hypothetical protein